jgi:Tfp pilus assembly protein PilF
MAMWKKVIWSLVLPASCAASQDAGLARPPHQDSPSLVRAASVDRAALMRQARFWESQGRDDLCIEALGKLLRVLPDDTGALAELALAQTRANLGAQARATLQRLRRLDSRHSVFAQVAALERLAKTDRNRLRQVRMLAKAGRNDEALAAMRTLFPQGMPTPELELEYWQIVAANPNSWAQAHAGLAALLREYPDNVRFQVALADHVLVRQPDDPASLKLLAKLARLPASEGLARPVWRRAMLRLAPTAGHAALVEEYLKQEKSEDVAVIDHLASMRGELEGRRRLLADPRYQARTAAMALFDAGKDQQAEEGLVAALRGQPDDPDMLGALGVLRMRQGFQIEAQAYFLQAARAAPSRAARWNAMARTARYWGLLKEASDGMAAADFALADSKLREAVALDAAAPDAWVAAARLYVAQKRPDKAEQAYRQALLRNKNELSAVRGLVLLYLDSGRDEEAAREQAQAALNPQQRLELDKEVGEVRAGRLQAQAEQELKAGRADAAAGMLARAVQYAPDNPWLRYDLARLQASRGMLDAGDALVDELLLRRPDDASVRYAAALYQSSRGQDARALMTLERIAAGARTEGMTKLQRSLWVAAVAQNAQRLAAGGERGAAAALLARTAAAIGNDAELALDVAAAQIDVGDTAGAATLLGSYERTYAAAADTGLRYARLLNRMEAETGLEAQFGRLVGLKLNPEQAADLAAIRKSAMLRRVSALRTAGKLDEALRLLHGAPTPVRDDAELLAAQARILRALGRTGEAIAAYDRLLEIRPIDASATINRIELLIEAGRRQEALAGIGDAARLPAQDGDYAADVVGALIALARYDDAAAMNAAAIECEPRHPRARLQASELAELRGDARLAMSRLQQGLALQAALRDEQGGVPLTRLRLESDASGKPRLAVEAATANAAALQATATGQYARLASMLDANANWVVGAIDSKSRAGTAGKSALRATEIPLEWRRPLGGGARLALRAEAVRYDAGTLDPAEREFASFGSALLCEAACAGPLEQGGKGVALSAAIDRGTLHADIGTTPLGFRLHSLVGGIARKGDVGPLGYTVEASRRAVTSSVLSYAGMVDPNTGRKWGGVTATGARLGLSLDQGGLVGGWASLGRYRLAGTGVQLNYRSQAMAGLTLRIVNGDDRLLSVGLTKMDWRHGVNAGEYTLGHGGYYSPARYRSTSLPLTYAERFGRWSVAVRAAISTSRSATDEAAYFPTDPALQARADELTAANFSNARYSGGSGGGRSHAASLAAEYQLGPRLFIGGRAELDRSPDYAPNHVLLYFRHALGRASAARPVDLLPQAVYPSSQN